MEDLNEKKSSSKYWQLGAESVLLGLARITSSGKPTLEQLLNRVARYFLSVFGADTVAIFLCSEGFKSVTLEAMASRRKDVPLVSEKITLRMGPQSLFARCLEAHGSVLRVDCSKTGSDIIDFSGLSELAAVPMRSDDGVVGLIVLGVRTTKTNWLDKSRERLLIAAADQAAVVIAKARLFHELELSEAKYRTMTENVLDVVFSLDRVGRFTFLNSRIYETLGYLPEELLGKYFSEIVTQESWQATMQVLEECRRSARSTAGYEWEARAKDGRSVILDVRAALSYAGGQFIGQYGIARDITEVRATKRRVSEMKDYLALVTEVQEEERRRIARELHDDTAQALIALSRKVELCKSAMGNQAILTRRLGELEDLLSQTIRNLREFIRALRPSVLDDLGLGAALDLLTKQAARNFGFKVKLDVDEGVGRLPSTVEVTLFRIAQEALNNAGRHSSAANVVVSLNVKDGMAVLTIQDDGCGFDVPASNVELRRMGKLGIAGMMERAEIAGGKLELHSVKGGGTRVSASVPLSQNA
ncbi:MAG TPA: PAS domain S-box protein [Firmicutes bacterium]|nr:PAS domain S-box protein [Bacillota bacterium]